MLHKNLQLQCTAFRKIQNFFRRNCHSSGLWTTAEDTQIKSYLLTLASIGRREPLDWAGDRESCCSHRSASCNGYCRQALDVDPSDLSHVRSVLYQHQNLYNHHSNTAEIFGIWNRFSQIDCIKMADNKFACDYAKRGTSACKKCKQKLQKEELRVAKIVPNPFSDGEGEMKQYFHAKCIFETFVRARATTKIIEDISDMEGSDTLKPEDKDMFNELISGRLI